MSDQKTLLLVDDDPTVLAMLAPILRHFGYVVLEAPSGKYACAVCEDAEIDLAILDYAMPEMTGIETARRLREQFGVPFVFLTVRRDQALLDAAISEGAYGYLLKPVAPEVVVPTIETALARAKAARHLTIAGQQTGDIKVAIGLLMGTTGMSRPAAEQHLRAVARREARRMVVVAQALIADFEQRREAEFPAVPPTDATC